MNMDAEGRTLRSRNAAGVQVKNRQAKTRARDVDLIKAYRWLIGCQQSKRDSEAGISFLRNHKLPPNLPKDETVWNFLARATGLSSKRIRQIIKNSENNSELARFPQNQSIQLKLL